MSVASQVYGQLLSSCQGGKVKSAVLLLVVGLLILIMGAVALGVQRSAGNTAPVLTNVMAFQIALGALLVILGAIQAARARKTIIPATTTLPSLDQSMLLNQSM